MTRDHLMGYTHVCEAAAEAQVLAEILARPVHVTHCSGAYLDPYPLGVPRRIADELLATGRDVGDAYREALAKKTTLAKATRADEVGILAHNARLGPDDEDEDDDQDDDGDAGTPPIATLEREIEKRDDLIVGLQAMIGSLQRELKDLRPREHERLLRICVAERSQPGRPASTASRSTG